VVSIIVIKGGYTTDVDLDMISLIEGWCEEHIGVFGVGWEWVIGGRNFLVLNIHDKEHAVLFRLTFR
jgi:hypothetical protein